MRKSVKNFRLSKVELALRERIKELTCLYELSQIVAEINEFSKEEIINKVLLLLPPAWQYSDITYATIWLDNSEYTLSEQQNSHSSMLAEIIIKGEKRGTINIHYTKNTPIADEGPFLKEERHLIDTIAKEFALIIERKESEEEKIKLKNQLQHAERLATIGELAAGIAHELNEPLASILGFAQLLKKDKDLSKQAVSDINKIINSSLHAREIVKNLMFFSRQMPIEKKKINLNRVIEKGLSFLESRCLKEGVKFEYSFSSTPPYIVADAVQINQVLINLAVNAIQAMPAGGKLFIQTLCSNEFVSLIVEDTGIGMDEAVKKQLFTPFFSTKEMGEGTGLGLSVVYGIVEAHKGSIEVTSDLGKGTKFEIKFPLNKKHK